MALEAADAATQGLALADTEIDWDRFANRIFPYLCVIIMLFHFFLCMCSGDRSLCCVSLLCSLHLKALKRFLIFCLLV